MKDQPSIKLPATSLKEICDILAAITREASHRRIDEIMDLAGRANKLATTLLRQETCGKSS